MTKKERKAIKEQFLWITERKNWSKEQKKLDCEISCREMIDSIICYGKQEFNYVISDKYLESYIEELGLEKVEELVQEQLDEKPLVKRNVYTDCEGLTYNSLIFKDEEGYVYE